MSDNSSSNSLTLYCSTAGISIFTALFIGYILLLPLFFLVLYICYQRWRKQCTVAMAATMNHSDIFTLNMVVMDLISFLGACFLCYGTYSNERFLLVGFRVFYFVSPGQTLFHLLTCVERYLAVVHPITYMRMRQRGGVRIRNISIVCVWLLCFGYQCMLFSELYIFTFFIFPFFLLSVSFLGISFCSLSVLCVLIRPGPGEAGVNRKPNDQSKLRAFHTIMAIMAALFLRFLSLLVSTIAGVSDLFSQIDLCEIIWSAAWFTLPSSLVLPLLFLQQAGKLPGCKRNTESG